MAMTQLELNTVSRGLQAARKVLDELYPVLLTLNVVYDAEGGAKKTIAQDGLDATASYSGLTKAQLDDGMYVLTAVLRPAIANGLTALAELAARA